MDIHRSPTSATGGLTAEELSALELHHRLWADRSNRTAPIEPEKITPAVIALYRAAGLQQPRVILVSSPGVLAFAGTFASFIWERRQTDADYLSKLPESLPSTLSTASKGIAQAVLQATSSAVSKHNDDVDGLIIGPSSIVNLTREATFDDADSETANSQDRATIAAIQTTFDVTDLTDLSFAIRNAMKDDFGNPVLTEMLSSAVDSWGRALATELFGDVVDAESVTHRVADWWVHCASGGAWTYEDYQITAGRDILRLQLPEYANYTPWEECAIHGGYRYLHPKFCLVCDFPTEINDRNLAYISPRSYVWRDGWTV